jgi:NADPH-dependent curcumin reductase CurA
VPTDPATVPSGPNRRIVLRRRPQGLLQADDVEMVTEDIPELAEGEALMQAELLGMDATVRSWLNEGEGYLPAVEIGEVVRCSGIGRIVATRSPAYEVGDIAYSLPGMQDYAIVRDDFFTSKLPPGTELAPMLSVYGATGLAAYVGLIEVGRVREGDTVVVSAAAGATGSLAGQIAKRYGCRVVGVAGTPEKCRFVVEELGFDACIDHRRDDLRAALKEHCPKRVDVYFDNVGGPVLDAVLGRLAQGGRVALCGAISVYNDTHKPPGPANYLELINRRGTMQGFIALDHWGRFPEIRETLRAWVEDGSLRHVEHTFEGLGSAVEALNALFTGANTGKVVVRVAD